MTRQTYIEGLDTILNTMIAVIGQHHEFELTDANSIEQGRYRKTAKLMKDLASRLYEDIAISTKVAVDKAATGEQGDLFDK